MRLTFQLALICIALAGPLFALKVALKLEERPFEATPLKLDGNSLTYKRGSKEFTCSIDDFVADSAFELRKVLTPREAKPLLELARFALHRELYTQARDCGKDALALDKGIAGDLAQLSALADVLESEALYSQANACIDAADVEGARKQLNTLIARFKGSSACRRGEALLATLDQLATELKQKAMEEEARKAQDLADAELRKKRQPIDDWLQEFDTQLGADEARLRDADADARAGRTGKGLGAMEEIVNATMKIRDGLTKNASYLIYDGQVDRAKAIDERALKLIVDSYERWGNHLFTMKNFALASKMCERGLEFDPKDRRLLSLKVDIDEVYDKKSVLDGVTPPVKDD
jgi:hypothetical protein